MQPGPTGCIWQLSSEANKARSRATTLLSFPDGLLWTPTRTIFLDGERLLIKRGWTVTDSTLDPTRLSRRGLLQGLVTVVIVDEGAQGLAHLQGMPTDRQRVDQFQGLQDLQDLLLPLKHCCQWATSAHVWKKGNSHFHKGFEPHLLVWILFCPHLARSISAPTRRSTHGTTSTALPN